MTEEEMIATARFDACERHPGFTKAMTAAPPRGRVPIAQVLPLVLFLAFFSAVGVFILRGFLAQAPLPMVLFAFGVVGFGVVGVGSQIARPFLRARQSGGVERCVAVVIACAAGRATLAYRDGKRRDVRAAGDLAIARGEIGVAYLRDGALAGFATLS